MRREFCIMRSVNSMTTILEQIEQWARAAGVTHVREIQRDQLKTFDHVRESCAANACGRYGRCWTCPPELGDLATLTAELQSFGRGVVVQNVTALEDSWDFEGMTAAAQKHNDMMRDLRRRLAAEYPDCQTLVLGCGGCGFCETCTCPDSACAAPDEALASVEGYGLDVKMLIESCGLSYINGQNTVSFVGAVLVE